MNGNELLKKLRKIAKAKGLPLETINERGKGSHITVKIGNHRTTMKDRKKEIGKGLLKTMLDQLGIDKNDI
jgi:mRNA interferase HicA